MIDLDLQVPVCRLHGFDHRPDRCWSCAEIRSGRIPENPEPAVLFGTTCGVCGLDLITGPGLTERCRPQHSPGVVA